MKTLDPLYTAKQWLSRWKVAGMSPADAARRLLADAGGEAAAPDADDSTAHALEALLGGGGGGGGGGAEQLTSALVKVLLRLARSGRPLMLCVEDAEHLDSGSLEVLSALLAELSDSALFVLVAVRSSQGVTDVVMKRWLAGT